MIIYFYVKMIIEVSKAGHSLPCQALCLSAPWPLCLAPWSSTLEFSHVVLFENHTNSRPVNTTVTTCFIAKKYDILWWNFHVQVSAMGYEVWGWLWIGDYVDWHFSRTNGLGMSHNGYLNSLLWNGDGSACDPAVISLPWPDGAGPYWYSSPLYVLEVCF
jgi:hypothetical protein